ncbi:N-acetyl sugar amidotransferase [Microbacterium sp. NPDC057650]|uniref:N-acetyl sugar amidotransferase n=1 Tax=unclassified Microbacterium TaxID=2609290 RepID=UPI00366F9292
MTGDTRPYQRCTRTIMDTTDPDITFDEHGVSNHATNYDVFMGKVVDKALAGEALPELEAMVAEIKKAGEGKPYDCIVGVSGGVDSTYLLMKAVELGLRPLAVHFDSGWNSELAVGNIQNLVTTLGVDLYTHVVDWREMKDLQLSFFKASVANCDIPTDHAFGYVAFQQARKYGIKYILSGSNYASESILPRAWGYSSDDAKHLKAIQKRFGTVKLKSYPVMGMFRRHIWYPMVVGIKTVRPLNLMPYVYTDAKRDITERVGWRDYGGKHYESVFTRYFQGYYLPHKFGFDKRLAHYSSLIVSHQITRDEALGLMETENYPEQLREQDHEFIAKKLGVSVAELEEIFAKPPVPYNAYPTSEKSWAIVMRGAWLVNGVLKRLHLKK